MVVKMIERKWDPESIAQEILSVQPIDPKPMQDLMQWFKDNPGKELRIVAGKKDK
jgi:hypothetical protein